MSEENIMAASDEFEPIRSQEELAVAVERIQSRHPGCLLLFRGQTHLYPSVRSGRSRSGFNANRAVDKGWQAVVAALLAPEGDGELPDPRTTGAILQHYGLATHYVDLTSDPRIAAWFACNQYNEKTPMYAGTAIRKYKVAYYTPLKADCGYIIVLLFESAQKEIDSLHLFDLADIPGAERPKRQKGWLMYDRRPVLPDPNQYCRYVLRIDRTVYSDADLNQHHLFPGPEEDHIYDGLVSVPYVQIPSAMIEDLAPKSESATSEDSASEAEHDACSVDSSADHMDENAASERSEMFARMCFGMGAAPDPSPHFRDQYRRVTHLAYMDRIDRVRGWRRPV